jgi:hypothetical protein
MRPFAAIFLIAPLAAPAAAQEAPTAADLAGLALEVCVRDAPPEGEVATGDFAPTGREGDTATYAHPSGPTLALTARPGFFACELAVPGAGEAVYEAMLAEVSPAMQERFEAAEPEGIETGMVWEAISEAGYAVETLVERKKDGTVRFTSATGIDENEPAPLQRDN